MIPLELLPRRCPFCGQMTIIGHGRRLRPAHDEQHKSLWVRRGLCQPCHKAFTILPYWLAPSAPYTFHCRRQACEQIAAGDSVERAAPDCKDPSSSPDASTVRRWVWKRVISVCCWLTNAAVRPFLQMPTILAWDLEAACRILPIEARSP